MYSREASPAATSAPPSNASQPLPCLLKPVLRPSKETLETARRWRAGPPARFTSKCPRMSHYFAPPLVNPLHLRVRNLTFWADFRPFWPISVQFRLTRRHPHAPNPVILVPRHGNPRPLALRRRTSPLLSTTQLSVHSSAKHEKGDAQSPTTSLELHLERRTPALPAAPGRATVRIRGGSGGAYGI